MTSETVTMAATMAATTTNTTTNTSTNATTGTSTTESVDDKSTATIRKPANATIRRLRILYVSYFAALGILQPYLPLYFNSLGYNGKTIGSLGAITPAVTVLMAPFCGYYFDQTNNASIVLLCLIVSAVVGNLLLCFVTSTAATTDAGATIEIPSQSYALVSTIVAITALFGSSIKPLLDSMCMKCLRASGADSDDNTKYFGKVRIYGLIGYGVANAAGGFIWNAASTDSDPQRGFRYLFQLHGALHLPVVWLLATSTAAANATTTKKSATPHPALRRSIFSNFTSDTILFFAIIAWLGSSSAISESFGFVRLQEIGGNGIHMGICRFLSTMAAFVVTMLPHNDRSIGTTLTISLVAVSLRFWMYGWMTAPHHAYLADMLRGMSYGFFWASSSVHATNVVSSEYTATSLMVLNACYNGIGRSSGAVVNGFMKDMFGTQGVFQFAAFSNTMFAILLYSYLRLTSPTSSLRMGSSHVSKKAS